MLRIGNSRSGMTLLELMVMMFIMVLISGIVVTAVGSTLENARLSAAVRLVIATLRYARNFAVTHQASTAVIFDSVRRGLAVQVNMPDENGNAQWVALTTPAGRFHALPEQVDIASVLINTATTMDNGQPISSTLTAPSVDDGQTAVTFTLLGQADDTCVTLRNTHGKQAMIIVDPVTGRCEFLDKGSNAH